MIVVLCSFTSIQVLYLIRDRPNICNNLHLPAQSGSNSVLESMQRGYTVEAYVDLVDHIRRIIPGNFYAIFPGR